MTRLTAISLFSGAGGMDVGFAQGGFDTVWANDINQDACLTFAANISSVIRHGPLAAHVDALDDQPSPDLVFGGPPCQGFSVAGRMDPGDPRSQQVFAFMDAVRRTRPRAFVMENVKALAMLEKFGSIREDLFRQARLLGYDFSLKVLRASDYGVPQARERMFFVGFRDGLRSRDFDAHVAANTRTAPTLRDVILPLGRAGSERNSRVCKARVTIAANPVLRRSPYAGMLFNGQGRPLNPNGFASTLPATMGGNRTPIIDEPHLFDGTPSWVEGYHARLLQGERPLAIDAAPPQLRRLTIDEAITIQTFPANYDFKGKASSVFAQIGNAVPCALACRVAESVAAVLNGYRSNSAMTGQHNMELLVA